MNYDYSEQNTYFAKKGFSNLFLDEIKSIVALQNPSVAILSKDDLPNSKVCVETEPV